MTKKSEQHLQHQHDLDLTEYFIDGITNISYNTGAFRFELASVASKPGETAETAETSLNTKARIVMTPQGYIQTLNALENFLKQVEDKGIIRREAREESQDQARAA